MFAFLVPSSGDDSVEPSLFGKQVVAKLCGQENRDEPQLEAAALRRLWFEAHVIAVGGRTVG